MPRSFTQPLAEELKSGWLQVDICMRLAFSFYVWQKHFQPPNDASDECKFMRDRRFREFDTTWNTLLLLRRAYDHFRPFVDYISHVEFAGQTNIRASIAAMKNRYETWLSEMDAIAHAGRA